MNNDRLIDLYTAMRRIRQVQLRIEKHYHEDEMKTPVHLCIGQEASAAGVCLALEKDDRVFSNHRGHGHYLAKGGSLKAMIAELFGKSTGCSRSKGGSMHLADASVGLMGSSSIVGGGIPLATGAALTSLLRKDKRVSVAFFGDAASEEGVIYESINFAVLKKLPVIYVCENNYYSVCSPIGNRQPSGDIYAKFTGMGLPVHKVDGTDVVQVHMLACKAVERARRGDGPSFIECTAYRWRGHAGPGPDTELGYRTQEELDIWTARCPIDQLAGKLASDGVLTEPMKKEIDGRIEREIDEAFAYARSSPYPDEKELYDHVN